MAVAELDRERMLQSVRHGRPGTAMTAYVTRLQPQEIEAVVDFIRHAFMPLESGPAPRKNSVDHNLSGLTGNPANGEALYLMNCIACHGVKGDGNGPRAYFIYPRPRNFLRAESRAVFDEERLFDAISNGVRGKEMPAWGKVLSAQQIADITAYVSAACIHNDDPAQSRP